MRTVFYNQVVASVAMLLATGIATDPIRQSQLIDTKAPQVKKDDVIETSIGPIVLGPVIGSGTFADVFIGSHEGVSDNRFAVKVAQRHEFNQKHRLGSAGPDFGTLTHEINVLRDLQDIESKVPRIYAWEAFKEPRFIVMELLGKSLGDALQAGEVSVPEAMIKVIDCFESVHDRGYVMNDVHENNFVIDSNGDMVMIDFALASRYREYEEFDAGFYSFGGIDETSIREDANLVLSPRDDLEKLIYLLVANLNGFSNLPWNAGKDMSEKKLIKKQLTPEELCVGKAQWLLPAAKHILSLGFYDRPDYDLIRSCFKQLV